MEVPTGLEKAWLTLTSFGSLGFSIIIGCVIIGLSIVLAKVIEAYVRKRITDRLIEERYIMKYLDTGDSKYYKYVLGFPVYTEVSEKPRKLTFGKKRKIEKISVSMTNPISKEVENREETLVKTESTEVQNQSTLDKIEENKDRKEERNRKLKFKYA